MDILRWDLYPRRVDGGFMTSTPFINKSPMLCGLAGRSPQSKATSLPASWDVTSQDSAIYQSIREVTSPLRNLENLTISSRPLEGSTDQYGSGLYSYPRVPPEGFEVYSHASHMHRGQLKLALYVNHGHITVHVIQARNLRPKSSGACDSFVKVSLVPEDCERTTCTTEMVYGTNNPLFDEKFSFEMLEQDKKKRLMVSLWNKDRENSGKKELLGCMSFGMKHMLCKKKERRVGGWYYLLSEDLGHRKHLQAVPKKSRAHKSIPEVNKDLTGLDSVTMVIHRAKSGYGFTVIGGCPVQVGRIEESSHAKTAGLQKGDCIVRINGQNVSRSSADSVAKLLKNSQKQVVLDVQRQLAPESMESRIPQLPPRKPSRKSSPIYEALSWKENAENIPHNNSSSSSTKRQSSHDGSASSWQMGGRNDECSLHQKSSSTGTYEDLSIEQNNIAMVVEESMWANVGTDDELSDMEHSMTELDETHDERLEALPQLTLSFQDLTCIEQERQSAVQQLLQCEREFIECMQYGVQRYSRPLRHCILTPHEHSTLFQNIEKLLAISEFHVRQLQENSLGYTEMDTTVDRFIDSVGEYYHSKVFVMCEAYERYCNGAGNAARLLSELSQYEEFNKFLEESRSASQRLTIRHFLDRPIQHIQALATHFEHICSLTQASHHDYSDLKDVAKVLQGALTRISKNNKRRTRSSAMSTSSHSSGHSRSSSRLGTSSASIDSELLSLQSRLVFPKHIKAFPLATPSRHVIYSGELLLVQKTKWARLTVLLLSDLLLLTKAEANNKLLVVEEPILLSTISSSEFDRMHPSEFELGTSCHGNRESKNLLFRAPSLELKCTWKNILEQRVAACRGQRDVL